MGYIDKKCESYPCHEDLEDCTYCYCPIYPCKCENIGKLITLMDGKRNTLWDCSKCSIFHKKVMIDFINKIKDVKND